MKKWISITALFLNLIPNSKAAEISKEKFFDLMLVKKESFEKVIPGMYTRRTGVLEIRTDEAGKITECRKTSENTVVQVLGTQRLV